MQLKCILIFTILTLFLLSTAIFAVAKEYAETTTLKFEEQWIASPHNFDPELRTSSEEAGCVRCHNSEWFIRIQIKGEKQPAANLESPPKLGLTCNTCHEAENPTNILALRKVGDVTLPAHNDVVSAGVSALCMSCHNGRRVDPEKYILTSTRGTHGGPQSDMLSGTGAITYAKVLRMIKNIDIKPIY